MADNVVVGARFHPAAATAPTILFFHGNGEIVADYDELAPFYQRQGVNFFPVDYRGYGRSTGDPTVSAMMRDCHEIFRFARQWLPEMGYPGPLVVMGRSLGSASALELAAAYPDQVAALIVESGFAYAGPLLQLLGVNLAAIGFKETAGFRNIDKIRAYPGPTLIIHAEHDHIIPLSDGQALYDAAGASRQDPAQNPPRQPQRHPPPGLRGLHGGHPDFGPPPPARIIPPGRLRGEMSRYRGLSRPWFSSRRTCQADQ